MRTDRRPDRSRAPRELLFALIPSCALISLTALGCTKTPAAQAESPPPAPTGRPVAFRYPKADGTGALGSQSFAGHVTVLIFVTSYDLASQAQSRFLAMALRERPAARGAAVALEPLDNAPLVAAFGRSLELPYPVLLGDPASVRGEGPFGALTVPTTIVLDADGRVVWREPGLVKDTELVGAIEGATRSRR